MILFSTDAWVYLKLALLSNIICLTRETSSYYVLLAMQDELLGTGRKFWVGEKIAPMGIVFLLVDVYGTDLFVL